MHLTLAGVVTLQVLAAQDPPKVPTEGPRIEAADPVLPGWDCARYVVVKPWAEHHRGFVREALSVDRHPERGEVRPG